MRTHLLLLVALLLPIAAHAQMLPGPTHDLGTPGTCTADVRNEVTRGPLARPMPALHGPELPRLEGYILADSMQTRFFVPPGDEQCVFFDASAQTLSELPAYQITPVARQAIEYAPEWLRMDLECNLRLLPEAQQDRYGNLLMSFANPALIDEVAFQIAHLSWTILQNPYWDETVLIANASMLYQIDLELGYVEIVEYGLGTDEQYSTTRYEVDIAGERTSVEIPREIYYWYVVMPKLSDERPLQDASVYNLFWREYLFYHNDAGYPLMQAVITPLAVLWDGQQHDLSAGRPFTPDMLVLDAIGNWVSETVPYPAAGNRPIQPNQIAHEHDGNCGELQDLLCAAARACLVPCLCTMDILEDHVWCEFWWDGTWHPYQVDLGHGPTHIANPGIAYDRDMGGSKDCSCIWDWRNDGFTWESIATYSETCLLTITIEDPYGIPVDNAEVTLASEFYYSPYTLYPGLISNTGPDGTVQFELGNLQNYYVRVVTSLGNYPTSGYALIISDSQTGEHYQWSWTTTGEMIQLAMTPETPGAYSDYVIEVIYDLPYDVLFGKDIFDSPLSFYSEPVPDGHLDFFIADAANFAGYQARDPFHAYEIAEGLTSNHVFFHTPSLEDYYIVLSGAEHHGLSTRADVTVRLWERDPAAADEPPLRALAFADVPSPVAGPVTLQFHLPEAGRASLAVYDAGGRLVRTLLDELRGPGHHRVAWDGSAPAGAYFLTLSSGGSRVTERILRVE